MLPVELPGCRILGTEQVGQQLVVIAAGTARAQTCPDCGHESRVEHSSYVRTIRDLPVLGRSVRLRILVRRWRCLNRHCRRATFCETFEGLTKRYAQRTERMTDTMEHFVLTISSNTAAHLLKLMSLEVSGRTLLRIVDHGEVRAPAPRAIGVDDFAVRKGQTYNTLIVDLERGKPVDILAGRNKEPLQEWLRSRSGIEIAARDRASSYADAIRAGAPQAVQVADRFHLVKNVTEALKDVVDRQSWALPEPAPLPVSPFLSDPAPDPPVSESRPKRMTRQEQRKVAAADRLQRRYDEVHRLRSSGLSIARIRKVTGLSRPTIYKYLGSNEVPKRAELCRRPSQLDPFMELLSERWEAGCHQARTLYEEIVQQGYTGSIQTLRRAIQPWRAACPPPRPKAQRHQRLRETNLNSTVTWKEVRAAVLRLPEHLNEKQRRLLPDFLNLHPKLALARNLVEQFRRLLKDHDSDAFDAWLAEAAQSELAPFERLARTLNADRAAVLAAITLPWSTGLVEGHITRVKLIKRIGYGRASLPLLRARVLYSAQRDNRPQARKRPRKGVSQHAVA